MKGEDSGAPEACPSSSVSVDPASRVGEDGRMRTPRTVTYSTLRCAVPQEQHHRNHATMVQS